MKHRHFPAINAGFLTGDSDNWHIEELSSIGFAGLEVTPADVRQGAQVDKAIDLGLHPVCINTLPELIPYLTGSLNDAVPWRRTDTLDRLLGILPRMAEYEVPLMVVAPGRLAENYQAAEQARELLVSALRDLSREAESDILLESAPFRLFSSSDEISAIIDEVGMPNVGAALDVGHAMLSGEDPLESAATLGPRLRYVQIRDVQLGTGLARLDRHLPLGSGSADIASLRRLAKGRDWAACFCAPDSPIEEARRAFELMER